MSAEKIAEKIAEKWLKMSSKKIMIQNSVKLKIFRVP